MVFQTADDGVPPAADGSGFVDEYMPAVPPVMSYFLRRVASPEDAEQATEVIFQLAYPLTIAGQTVSVSWLLFQAHRYWLEELAPSTAPQPGPSTSSLPGDAEPAGARLGDDAAPEPAAWGHPLADALIGALRGLPVETAELLMLAGWERLSEQELAAFLSVGKGKIRRRLRAARRSLARRAVPNSGPQPGQPSGQRSAPDPFSGPLPGLPSAPDASADPGSLAALDPLLDPAVALACEEGRARALLDRIEADGLLISDTARRTARPTGPRPSAGRWVAAALFALVAAVVCALVFGLGLPPDPSAAGTQEAGAGPAEGAAIRPPVTTATYGPNHDWSRFEALEGSFGFDVPPQWMIRYIATSRQSRSTLFAEAVNPLGIVMATISVGGTPAGTANCPPGNGSTAASVTTVEQVPVPELAAGAGAATFSYQVIAGRSVTAVMGISDGSFGDGVPGCARINAFRRDAPGDPAFVFVGGGSEADGTGPLSFPAMQDALDYVHTPAYEQTRRLMTSLRIQPPETAPRRIVRDPATNAVACVVSNVRGPGNDTVYEDHPDNFVVLGCAGKFLAFRTSYQSDPSRPKTICFATTDGAGYTFDPDTSVRVLGWDELALQARGTGQDIGRMMDDNFAAAGLPVELREDLVGSGP